jgi:putative transposase
MGIARNQYIEEGEEGVYHCFARCVRRAFLCGFDKFMGRDCSHRKAWIVDRLRFLAGIFGIDVCAYAVLNNHYHVILRTRPDLVRQWTDSEVARRWLTLFPVHKKRRGKACLEFEEQVSVLSSCHERMGILRLRLSSLSWFMGRLNESIARSANREDEVKGKFWESRFKCQVLLDEAAIAAAMVYVDLNPVRAGMAETPEESEYTSIQERICAWQKERRGDINFGGIDDINVPFTDECNKTGRRNAAVKKSLSIGGKFLCPIQTDTERKGILEMGTEQYLDLVDRSGRLVRQGKSGVIDPDLAPILTRIGARSREWAETVRQFGSNFHIAAGCAESLRKFADRIGQKWVRGMTAASTAFAF